MTTRSSRRTITFERPFNLLSFDKEMPAGNYEVETDEELLEGVSFPAYRRILAVLHLHPTHCRPGETQALTVDPNELDAALERDRAHSEKLSQPETDQEGGETQKYRPAAFEDKRLESLVRRVHRDRKKGFFDLRHAERFRTDNGN